MVKKGGEREEGLEENGGRGKQGNVKFQLRLAVKRGRFKFDNTVLVFFVIPN